VSNSVNNLFQRRVFTAADFDALCEQLSPSASTLARVFSNPHRSLLGTGNYDVNVVGSKCSCDAHFMYSLHSALANFTINW
jgi:hypothetical protein